tara:strand:+ start:757 stop:1524 length:768 start_codon:yes stop_codon:yes gene_type:complete
MKNPKVSIVLPTNRFDKNLIRSIDSALNQTFKSIEVIIIINGENKDLISENLNRIYSLNQIKIHLVNTHFINFSLAYGVDISKGDFVVRLDSDDFMLESRIEEQYDFMISNHDYVIVGSYVQKVKNNQNHGINKYPINDKDIKNALFFKNPFCHPSTMLRKSVLLKMGSYQGGVLAEDYDLYLRLISFSKSIKFYNIPKVLLYYNIDDGEAKKSRRAYISMMSSQVYQLFYSRNIKWLISISISFFKMLFLSNKS